MGKSKEQKADTKPEAKPEAKEGEAGSAEATGEEKKADVPEIVPPPPKGEPWPDATPEPMRPVDPKGETPKSEPTKVEPAARAQNDTAEPRSHFDTVLMPMSSFEDDLGAPPEMPQTAPPPVAVAKAGAVEDPTHMPGPRDIPGGNPDDPASPPGLVPRGDSRSMRRGREFALVYRQGSSVISRFGVIGTRGQWRVVEYPTSVSAGRGYANQCSQFVSEGFLDYRE